jgi:hypothetical protein
MSTTQEGITTIVDDDKPKEKRAKNNEDEKKDGHVKTSDSNSNYNEDKTVKVTKKGGNKTFAKIPFNYDHLSGSTQSAPMHLGKPPRF